MGTALLAAPFVVAIALYGLVADAAGLAAGIFGLMVVLLALRSRLQIRASVGTQAITSIVTTVVLFATMSLLDLEASGPGTIRFGWSGLAASCLLNGILRFALRDPKGGPRLTYAAGFLALVACGETRIGPLYPMAVVLYTALTLAALRYEDREARLPLRSLGRRHLALGLGLPLAAAALSLLLIAPLRPTYEWVRQRMGMAYLAATGRVGFSDHMFLGSMDEMLESREVVLRIHGPKTDYLRGVVYDEYDGARWNTTNVDDPKEIRLGTGPLSGPDVVDIRFALSRVDRLYLPLAASDVSIPSGSARVDGAGVFRSLRAVPTRRLWFRPGSRNLGSANPPTEMDTQVLKSLAPYLEPKAFEWTQKAPTLEKKLVALQRRLRKEYKYSLHSSHPDHIDPVLDFLYVHKEGHCEYFATAMVLLARTLGIPSRVVGGYRQGERNPIGNYQIVRERDAHAWVEAWVEGRGWVTFDPTPAIEPAEDEARRGSRWSAIQDQVAAYWDALRTWLEDRSAGQLWTGTLVTALLLALFQWWRGERWDTLRTKEEEPMSPPLPCILHLLSHLERQGLRRHLSEPLEVFALRLEDEGARRLLLRYADLRYGGLGDERTLSQDVEAFLASRPRGPVAPPPHGPS